MSANHSLAAMEERALIFSMDTTVHALTEPTEHTVKLVIVHVCGNGKATLIVEDVDECLSIPCSNGGTCLDFLNNYHCACVDGYNGTHCELGMHVCFANNT